MRPTLQLAVVSALFACALGSPDAVTTALKETSPLPVLPVIANTWGFVNATARAWQVIQSGSNGSIALDAVVEGCGVCEVEQCDGTVGYGGSPDSNGETTLDAMIMDGKNLDVGAVGYLRRVRNAIGVARAVMEHSTETLLSGDGATAFATMMGFPEQSLSTPQSEAMYENWVTANCQPNYWANVYNQSTQCPPYTPEPMPAEMSATRSPRPVNAEVSQFNHDTIGMIAIDTSGHVVAGTSTNGANHKIAGRIGDSPIVGAGAYADDTVGAATETGDGDVMMRFLPSYQAVENMRNGMDPTAACEAALKRVGLYYPSFQGAIRCVRKDGAIGGAAWGWTFTYAYASPATAGKVVTVQVPPMNG